MTDLEDPLAREYRTRVQDLFQSINADETGPAIELVLEIENAHPEKSKAAHFAALETAFRGSFYKIIVRCSGSSGFEYKLTTCSLLFQSTTPPLNEYGSCWTLYQPSPTMVRGEARSPQPTTDD